jgi:nucleoside-diphosphate-sugar epimerase
MRVLVTGSAGFIGKHLVDRLASEGLDVIGTSRCAAPDPDGRTVASPELSSDADWSEHLRDIDTVIHLAGKAHVTGDTAKRSSQTNYHRINAEGTIRLAEQAATVGVRHFIFLSSCHAVAAESDHIISEQTPPHPASDYGRSKLAAEIGLKKALSGNKTSYTILRPPLVYGPGNLANFARLIKMVTSGIPLPFGSIKNRRSFIGVRNLSDIIFCCIGNSRVKNRTFFPSDCEDLSTPQLIDLIARAYGSPDRLFSVPEFFLLAASRILGMRVISKLLASLYVDSEPLREELRWLPPHTFEEGLRFSAEHKTLAQYHGSTRI